MRYCIYTQYDCLSMFVDTVNSEIFARILFLRIALKDIFVTVKIATKARFTYISK